MVRKLKLDKIDLDILDILQSSGRTSNAELADRLGLSPPAMLERVRKLERNGVIERYVALLDESKVGKDTVVFVMVSLSNHQRKTIQQFKRAVLKCNYTLECHHVSGEEDYLLKVVVESIPEYEKFLLGTLTQIPGVVRIKSSFVLSTLKRETKITLGR